MEDATDCLLLDSAYSESKMWGWTLGPLNSLLVLLPII